MTSTRAREAADTAAAQARIVVREASSVEAMAAVRHVFDTVWAADPTNPAATVELLRAYSHTGQYVVLADDLDSGQVVAASVGFLAAPIGRALHSNITGVLPAGLGRSLGFALKLHQRAWALERGLDLVTWTFDPLIRRNAWFNLAKLAARPAAYLENFYGSMDDGINAGDDSDRMYVRWPLDHEVVTRAVTGTPAVLDVEALRRNGYEVAVQVAGDGSPRRPAASSSGVGTAGTAGTAGINGTADTDARGLLVQVPADIEALRRTDPGLAAAWRAAVRETLGAAMAAGWTVRGVGREGWYVVDGPNSVDDRISVEEKP